MNKNIYIPLENYFFAHRFALSPLYFAHSLTPLCFLRRTLYRLLYELYILAAFHVCYLLYNSSVVTTKTSINDKTTSRNALRRQSNFHFTVLKYSTATGIFNSTSTGNSVGQSDGWRSNAVLREDVWCLE